MLAALADEDGLTISGVLRQLIHRADRDRKERANAGKCQKGPFDRCLP